MTERQITFTVQLDAKHAWAFAQFLKRVGFNDYRPLAVDVDEAYLMVEAGEAIRTELRAVGYAPR
ncbi:MAG: hypothetical protein LBF16_04370 [Pseudomonadales bacterium]|jgi:hypothetical protein|nr:hypothetical protein [Pseudomonadales bacterium]